MPSGIEYADRTPPGLATAFLLVVTVMALPRHKETARESEHRVGREQLAPSRAAPRGEWQPQHVVDRRVTARACLVACRERGGRDGEFVLECDIADHHDVVPDDPLRRIVRRRVDRDVELPVVLEQDRDMGPRCLSDTRIFCGSGSRASTSIVSGSRVTIRRSRSLWTSASLLTVDPTIAASSRPRLPSGRSGGVSAFRSSPRATRGAS